RSTSTRLSSSRATARSTPPCSPRSRRSADDALRRATPRPLRHRPPTGRRPRAGRDEGDAPAARHAPLRATGPAVRLRPGTARHYRPTALAGTFAAAAVAANLHGLTEGELVHAFGICGSQAGGIIEYLADGSWTKRLHPGWAAHAGVVATLLARSGFTGPETV